MDYRKMRDRNYLSAIDFDEGEQLVTIDRVEQGVVERQGEDDERVPLLYVLEYERPLILNYTNGEMLAVLYGSRDTRTWEGKRIYLTVGMTTDKQGKPCLGVRVSPRRPPELERVEETPAERLARMREELAKAEAAAAAPRELAAPNVANTVPAEITEEARRAAS